MADLDQQALLRLIMESGNKLPLLMQATQQKEQANSPQPFTPQSPSSAEADMNRMGMPSVMPQDVVRQLALLKAIAPKNTPPNPNLLPHSGGVLPPGFKPY